MKIGNFKERVGLQSYNLASLALFHVSILIEALLTKALLTKEALLTKDCTVELIAY